MLIPPWIIEDLEDERRREEERRPALDLPLEEAREQDPRAHAPSEERGVMVLDISPASPNTIPL